MGLRLSRFLTEVESQDQHLEVRTNISNTRNTFKEQVKQSLMYTYKLGISTEEHDRFLETHPQANILQSSNWAIIKDNWKHKRIGFYQDEELLAVALILIRPLPLGRTMYYIPRGPVMDYSNRELVTFVLNSLKAIAKKDRALMVKFDPNLRFKEAQVTEGLENWRALEDEASTAQALETLKSAGAIWLGRTENLDDTIQPRFHANIHRETFEAEDISKSTKQAMRTARNKGLEVVFGNVELLDDFTGLMKKTENRKNISLRGKDYYQKLLETYQGQSYITISYLDMTARLADLETALEKNAKEAEKFTEKTKPGKVKNNQDEKVRLSEEINFLKEQVSLGRERVPLSGTLTLVFGETSENIYAGMDETFRRYQPAILTWYETANHAFERGCAWQNMGGIENGLDGGLYNFKSKFNPHIEEYLGEFDVPTSIFYHPATFLLKLRKKLRKKF